MWAMIHLFLVERLKSSFRKFYGRYGDLVEQYGVTLSRMLNHILTLDQQWLPYRSDFPPDQTFHQFHDLYTELDSRGEIGGTPTTFQPPFNHKSGGSTTKPPFNHKSGGSTAKPPFNHKSGGQPVQIVRWRHTCVLAWYIRRNFFSKPFPLNTTHFNVYLLRWLYT